jgi:hypothetical protein
MTEERERAFFAGETEYLIYDGVAFTYDPVAGLFILTSGQNKHIADSFTPDLKQLIYKGGGEQSGLILNPFGIAVTPEFRQKIINYTQDPQKLQQILILVERSMRKVFQKNMPEAYNSMTELIEYDPEIPSSQTPFGFSVQIYPDDGRVILNTMGNCACLGPDWSGIGIITPSISSWSKRTDLPYKMSLHNIDFEAQEQSLLAGIGTLEWAIEGRQSDQIELGLIFESK